ncbi:hypothetical protein TNCV_2197501 [Trichonephila clavipes]|nr:hypothetical protein TNCV_2197501 [Trichonephila clavipes]
MFSYSTAFGDDLVILNQCQEMRTKLELAHSSNGNHSTPTGGRNVDSTNEASSVMENANLWLFTKEQLCNFKSGKCIEEAKESFCMKQDANFTQEIGGSLKAYPFWF